MFLSSSPIPSWLTPKVRCELVSLLLCSFLLLLPFCLTSSAKSQSQKIIYLSAFSNFYTQAAEHLARKKNHIPTWIGPVQIYYIQLSLGLQYSSMVPFPLFLSFSFTNIPNHHKVLKSLSQPTSSRLLTDYTSVDNYRKLRSLSKTLFNFPLP